MEISNADVTAIRALGRHIDAILATVARKSAEAGHQQIASGGVFMPAGSPDDFTALRLVSPENGSNFGLTELYALLDVQIVEVVYISIPRCLGLGTQGITPKWILICDEEGRMTSEPKLNHLATVFAGQPIFGNAVLVPPRSFR